MINKIKLLANDPKLIFKKKVCGFLKLEVVDAAEDADLIDLSFLDANDVSEAAEWAKDKKILIAPATVIKLPLDNLNNENVYVAFPLREWALAQQIIKMKNDDICGAMTSVRITWTRPKKEASSEHEFLFNTVVGLVDLACYITEMPIKQLYIEKVEGENNLFGLMMFGCEIAVELEANESLPNSMVATHFIKANFTDGIVTNVPLVGHFNEEGSIFATDEMCERLLVENSDWEGGNEMENTYWQMLLSINAGSYSNNIQQSRKIVEAVGNAVTSNTPVNFEESK